MGVITLRWNQCERELFYLFCEVSEIDPNTAWVLLHKLKDVEIWKSIKTIANQKALNPQVLELIENADKVYDQCRLNRNQITHFEMLPGTSWSSNKLERRSTQPHSMETSPFISDLKALRQVAEEIYDLGSRLWVLQCFLEEYRNGNDPPLPGKLPEPDALWTPPPNPNKQKRPPRSSQA
jgi:hypothetical protein